MKKIKLLTFLGALLCSFFIFNLNYKTSANSTKKIYEKIDLVYSSNFRVPEFYELTNSMQLRIVITDDIFINYMYEDDIDNNVYLQLDYSDAGFIIPYTINLSNSEIRNDNELHSSVYIPKSYFDYYIYDIVNTDEETFYNNFGSAMEYDLYQYFKLYVSIGEAPYTYMKFTDYNVTANLMENATYTTVYNVYIYIDAPYNLENDISLHFKKDVGTSNLRTPMNRNYNSYTIYDFQYINFRWRIHLNIALLNTFLINYNNDIDYVLEELIEIYIGVTPGQEYTNGYNTGYLDGIRDGEQLGWGDGYNTGYYQGYDEGYFDGVSDAYSQGYDAGYEEGLQASQGEAYDQGYKDGYNKSFIATMDKWLIPAIILVMFVGGFFAIARKKRDGDI